MSECNGRYPRVADRAGRQASALPCRRNTVTHHSCHWVAWPACACGWHSRDRGSGFCPLSPDSAGGRRRLAGVGRRNSAGGDRAAPQRPGRAPPAPSRHRPSVFLRHSLTHAAASPPLARPADRDRRRARAGLPPAPTPDNPRTGHTTPPQVRRRRQPPLPRVPLFHLSLALPFSSYAVVPSGRSRAFDVAPLCPAGHPDNGTRRRTAH